MKKMKCLDCDELFQSETKDSMLKAMLPHYQSVHADMMAGLSDETKEDWMKRFYDLWEKAEEL